MAFSANPLSLSVPEASFESWLRDTGYLEILDSHSTAAASAVATTDASPPPPLHKTAAAAATSTAVSLLSSIKTLTSLLSVNPFARLVSADLSGPTPPWTGSFLSRPSSYSFPAGPAQARMRVQENVKRYARNYAFLSLLFFACSLYRNPMSLLGCLLSLALWEMVRFAGSRWDMEERYPTLRQLLVRLVQLGNCIHKPKRKRIASNKMDTKHLLLFLHLLQGSCLIDASGLESGLLVNLFVLMACTKRQGLQLHRDLLGRNMTQM